MGKRAYNKLTAREVATLSSQGRHSDGGGLYLSISKDGRKRWVYLYTLNGRRREMGLGPAAGPSAVTLKDARESAVGASQLKERGVDPLDQQRRAAAEEISKAAALQLEATVPTFGAYADVYVARMSPSWKNPKHKKQWEMSLKAYCLPIRDLRIDKIDTELVMKVLQPIWLKVPVTATRLRGRIERVLDAARVEKFRTGENPARWRGQLDVLLPRRKRGSEKHHAALPSEDMWSFMTALKASDAIAARALEFCVLTATRTSEVIGAQWNEFDLDRATWTIPAHRMKTGREHRIPLSPRALEIVRELHNARISMQVFPSHHGRRLSNMAMLKVMQRTGFEHATVHGFRSTFRDWAAETTTFAHEVCEMALAHTIANKAEAAYRRGDLFEKRRELMNAWAVFCVTKPTPERIGTASAVG